MLTSVVSVVQFWSFFRFFEFAVLIKVGIFRAVVFLFEFHFQYCHQLCQCFGFEGFSNLRFCEIEEEEMYTT
jgi:hypothetical protein